MQRGEGSMKIFDQLQGARHKLGKSSTTGLSDSDIKHFLTFDKNLVKAIEYGLIALKNIEDEFSEMLQKPEETQITDLQKDFINFYDPNTVNPYVAIAAFGPWIFTSKGSIIYDAGGYGMLGLGHNPENIAKIMQNPLVMANIMTAQFSQMRFAKKIRQEIGQRGQKNPYQRFICLNSGSEAMTLAARLADINTLTQMANGKTSLGKNYLKTKYLSLTSGFHGRTERPSQFSDSCLKTYKKHLASFQDLDNLITVPINDTKALQLAFAQADKEQVFIEAFIMEPIMGEGNPGAAMSVDFYKLARELTLKSGALFIIDSIQAGLRGHGVLSICDYPGFENIIPPDIESFSKALNAGQFPFSMLALSKKASSLYKSGIYGNTMTTNPRALDIASEVLSCLDQRIRQNIVHQGKAILANLLSLKSEFPDLVTGAQGTGLLFSLEVNKNVKVVGADGLEQELRKAGLGVIHGGENSVRFTPHFAITDEEIALMMKTLTQVLSLRADDLEGEHKLLAVSKIS